MWRSVFLVILVGRVAHADNCVDAKEGLPPPEHACGDVGAGFATIGTWLAPDLADEDMTILPMTLYPHDDGERSWRFELWHAEMLLSDFGKPSDTNHDAPFSHSFVGSFIGLGTGRDHADWGWYATAHAATLAANEVRGLTPEFGLRIGRFDRLAAIATARLDGIGLAHLDPGHDFDLRLRVTKVMRPWVRLEARGRLRDATFGAHHVRDAFGAIGAEFAVTPHDGFRLIPMFAGIGVRGVIADESLPMTGVTMAPPAPAGWQMMAWLEGSFTINSSSGVW